ncbi:MAG TPA: hypothetical protein VFO25_08240 [Candidatus Eremiobacteraceae bacterium]|nr:hypothetical protein [Candidatus Eremiobacteraceae bacterium]
MQGSPPPIPSVTTAPTIMTSDQIVTLSLLATVGIVVMWLAFWTIVWVQKKETVAEILGKAAFFRALAVIGVVAAVTVLSLAGRMESNIAGAILSGTVGFVLGHLSSRESGAA